VGRFVFSELISHLPHKEFQKCVARYSGDRHHRGFSSWDQYLSMAFAQLTCRASLRDIEACLGSMKDKANHLGFRGKVARSTLADANETHDWRIFGHHPCRERISHGAFVPDQRRYRDERRRLFCQLYLRSIPIQKRIVELAERHLESQHRDVRNLATALFVHNERIFTFLEEDGVEPTNNRAERALPTGVQLRTISFGNRSAAGALATAYGSESGSS